MSHSLVSPSLHKFHAFHDLKPAEASNEKQSFYMLNINFPCSRSDRLVQCMIGQNSLGHSFALS